MPNNEATSRRQLLTRAARLSAALLVAPDMASAASGRSPRTVKKKTATRAPTSTIPPPTCRLTPSEIGPYPGDGSNIGPILTEPGIIRRDMRQSFGASATVATGVPATFRFTVRSVDRGCAPVAGAAVHLWHCDRTGGYSAFTEGLTSENYLRAVQVTDRSGTVSFQSIFPGSYKGRWPHVHLEVYPSLADAIAWPRTARLTTQLAIPFAAAAAAYETPGYEQSRAVLPLTPLSTDEAFKNGSDGQMLAVTGDERSGFVLSLNLDL